ncbi:hypothetical protein QVD99_005056 [Batrachochytrium dendrobatidis]|nr:hypothetical protein QVD99_005056 [Batrachochytrium dendrobatidis]
MTAITRNPTSTPATEYIASIPFNPTTVTSTTTNMASTHIPTTNNPTSSAALIPTPIDPVPSATSPATDRRTSTSLGTAGLSLSPPIRRSRAETFSTFSIQSAGTDSPFVPPVSDVARSPSLGLALGLPAKSNPDNLQPELELLQQHLLFPTSPPHQQQRMLPQHRGRHRTGSLSIPLHGISDAFSTALFSSNWQPAVAVPAPITEALSGRNADILDDFEGSTALVRTLDYLGLDDVPDSELQDTVDTKISPAQGQSSFKLASHQQASRSSISHSPILKSSQQMDRLFWDSTTFAGPSALQSLSASSTIQPRARSVSFMSTRHQSRFPVTDPGALLADSTPYTKPFSLSSTPSRPRSSTIAYAEPIRETQSPYSFGMQTLGSFSTPSLLSMEHMLDPSSAWDMPRSPFQSRHADPIGASLGEYGERLSNVASVTEEPHSLLFGDAASGQDGNSEDFSYQEMHVPSRSLWVGNIDALMSSADLHVIFSPFGLIESIRMLPEKECAFINFMNIEDAVVARQQMHGGRIRNNIVRAGFGKSDPGTTEVHGTQPTKSIWIGNISPTTNPAALEGIFSCFGQVESARVLTHKNCGFVNFVHVQDAIRARNEMNNQDIGGFVVKIGFAKVPSKTDAIAGIGITSNGVSSTNIPATSLSSSVTGAIQAPSSSPKTLLNTASPQPGLSVALSVGTPMLNKNRSPLLSSDSDSNLQEEPSLLDQLPCVVPDIVYATSIPRLPEANPQHAIEPGRLRDIRKRLDGMMTPRDIGAIYQETIGDAAQLCSDYIGNIVIQKVVEKCPEPQRQFLVESVAPHLPALGVHKNGTWAVQKIIERAKTHAEIVAIVDAIRPFTPPLLMDQFGNYVVQCCLRLGPQYNQFIFDSLYSVCLDLGQGRYGARGMRACLESSYTTKDQQKLLQIAITQHAAPLSMNSNGAILLTWLMDVCPFSGRYRALVNSIAPCIVALATHKLASVCVLKLVIQQAELDAREKTLYELFEREANLDAILSDHAHGVVLLQKILSSAYNTNEERLRLAELTRQGLERCSSNTNLDGHLTYRRLLDELAAIGLTPDLHHTSGASAVSHSPLHLSTFTPSLTDNQIHAATTAQLATTPTFQRAPGVFGVAGDESMSYTPSRNMTEDAGCVDGSGLYLHNNSSSISTNSYHHSTHVTTHDNTTSGGLFSQADEALPSPRLTPLMPFSSQSPVMAQPQHLQSSAYRSVYDQPYDSMQQHMYVYPPMYGYPSQYSQYQQPQQFQQNRNSPLQPPLQESQDQQINQPSTLNHLYGHAL